MTIVARVTINGGNFIFDTIIPLKRPKKEPTNMPAIIENMMLNFAPNRIAMTIPTNEISEPTERSIPFVSMTRDIPKAIIANGLLCNKILVTFIGLKNFGAVIAKTITEMKRTGKSEAIFAVTGLKKKYTTESFVDLLERAKLKVVTLNTNQRLKGHVAVCTIR